MIDLNLKKYHLILFFACKFIAFSICSVCYYKYADACCLFHINGIALIFNIKQMVKFVQKVAQSWNPTCDNALFANISDEMHFRKVSSWLLYKEVCCWIVFSRWTRNAHSLSSLVKTLLRWYISLESETSESSFAHFHFLQDCLAIF